MVDRLTSYEQNATDYQRFTYDANGNRLTQNQEVNKSQSYIYTDNTNTLEGIKYYHTLDENTTTITKDINYTYDKTGNIISDGTYTYTYDGRNRLTKVDENVTYQYNYDNKRVSKTVNNQTTYYLYEAHKLIGEYQEDGTATKEYVYYNDIPIAVITDTDTHKIYTDHLDTPRRVADNTNNIVWEWESKPFGEDKPTGSYTLNLRFPGQYFDSETNTHYNINRDYNPIIGRYIQSDPIGFDGGVNTFGYVKNNPIDSIDLEGLKCTVKQQIKLQLAVQISCKWTPRKCTANDSCIENKAKIGVNSACATARKAINNKCYNGGDSGHKQARLDAINALNICLKLTSQCCKDSWLNTDNWF